MPKPHTYPPLYNEALQISLSKLKEWGCLAPEQIQSGTLEWSSNGHPTGSISIKVSTHTETPYIELDYQYKDQPRNYKVRLVSMPSNLGKGLIWYFMCPRTNKRCRKLHLIGGYFLHRSAFKGCYGTQAKSKHQRRLHKTLGAFFSTPHLYSQLQQKHFKKTYAGKPTKRYLRIMEQIQKAESTPYPEIEQLFFGMRG